MAAAASLSQSPSPLPRAGIRLKRCEFGTFRLVPSSGGGMTVAGVAEQSAAARKGLCNGQRCWLVDRTGKDDGKKRSLLITDATTTADVDAFLDEANRIYVFTGDPPPLFDDDKEGEETAAVGEQLGLRGPSLPTSATEETLDGRRSTAVSVQPLTAADRDYCVKRIRLSDGRNVSIVMQDKNGPCSMLAIINWLLLLDKTTLPWGIEVVTCTELINHIANHILHHCSAKHRFTAQDIDTAIGVLPNTLTGLDVNVKFAGVKEFEQSSSSTLFRMLGIPLYHGWLVDPQRQTELAMLVSQHSHDQLQNAVVEWWESGDVDRSMDAVLARRFLKGQQLTSHGISELKRHMGNGELAVLFQENHFTTVLKHGTDLVMLVTAEAYLDESSAVWQTVSVSGEDSRFYGDGEIALAAAPNLDAPTSSSLLSPTREESTAARPVTALPGRKPPSRPLSQSPEAPGPSSRNAPPMKQRRQTSPVTNQKPRSAASRVVEKLKAALTGKKPEEKNRGPSDIQRHHLRRLLRQYAKAKPLTLEAHKHLRRRFRDRWEEIDFATAIVDLGDLRRDVEQLEKEKAQKAKESEKKRLQSQTPLHESQAPPQKDTVECRRQSARFANRPVLTYVGNEAIFSSDEEVADTIEQENNSSDTDDDYEESSLSESDDSDSERPVDDDEESIGGEQLGVRRHNLLPNASFIADNNRHEEEAEMTDEDAEAMAELSAVYGRRAPELPPAVDPYSTGSRLAKANPYQEKLISQCFICGKNNACMNDSAERARHYRTKHANVPASSWKCPVCPYLGHGHGSTWHDFVASLNQHIKQSHSKAEENRQGYYRCLFGYTAGCQQRFFSYDDLEIHTNTHHQDALTTGDCPLQKDKDVQCPFNCMRPMKKKNQRLETVAEKPVLSMLVHFQSLHGPFLPKVTGYRCPYCHTPSVSHTASVWHKYHCSHRDNPLPAPHIFEPQRGSRSTVAVQKYKRPEQLLAPGALRLEVTRRWKIQTGKYRCPVCSTYTSNFRWRLEHHKRMKHGDTTHCKEKCETCGAPLKNRKSVNSHNRREHGIYTSRKEPLTHHYE